ncbi:hypothetical protein NE237_015469 [Protea cynaroides]|uniref:Uncharacterized protein n=1 Tax=Protea cynaroides TaxID=273540 RepID=A0A9Q0KDW5_9MAGN|nr:hypothetical protein NE237_015469 [Protea cynaroides]
MGTVPSGDDDTDEPSDEPQYAALGCYVHIGRRTNENSGKSGANQMPLWCGEAGGVIQSTASEAVLVVLLSACDNVLTLEEGWEKSHLKSLWYCMDLLREL